MSETPGESSTDNEEAGKKKKSVLEDKSKDDLIQIVKKQLNLLQKAKGKSDELNRKCTVLENEVENHAKHEEELQDQIKIHEKEIVKLKQINDNFSIEKEHEISEFKEKIDSYEKEKLIALSQLHEKDEQVECLSMQLDTVKKTCQCLQEELMKYQKLCEELKVEVKTTSDARDTAVQSLKDQNLLFENKLKEYSMLYNESVEIKNKYSLCIEENCTLNSKLEESNQLINDLQTLNKDLLVQKTEISERLEKSEKTPNSTWQNDSEISFLIADNQKLLLELNNLKEENRELKEKIIPFENNVGKGSTVDDGQNNQNASDNKVLKTQQELNSMQTILCDLESVNNSLKRENETLKEEYQTILLELGEIKNIHKDIENKLETCTNEKLNLESEVKKLSSILNEMGDSKSGFELALLHGAESESLKQHSIPRSDDDQPTKVNKQELTENLVSESSIMSEEVNFSSFGFEYALLDGGSISGMCVNSIQSEGSVDEIVNMSQNCTTDQGTTFEEKKPDKCMENEIILLRERLEMYAESLKETLEENESLKLKMEEYENEKSRKYDSLVEVFTNTETNFIETSVFEENVSKLANCENVILTLRQENSNLNEKISQLETNLNSIVEEHNGFQNEVNLMIKNLDDLKILNFHLEEKVSIFEKENSETSEKLQKKCKEISNYHTDLQLLGFYLLETIGPNSVFCGSDKELLCSKESLKILIEELAALYLSNCSALKDFEENLENCNDQKQKLEEKFCHSEELNKFLEEEVKALQDEIENLKNESNYYNKNYNNFSDTMCSSGPSELYSIEEANESEEKGMVGECLQNQDASGSFNENVDTFTNNSALHITEIDTLTEEQEASKDISIQTDVFFQEQFNNSLKATSNNESSVDSESIQIIEDAINYSSFEADKLKLETSLKYKSDEVESLLKEIAIKNDDLLKSANKITELQEKFKDLLNEVDSNKIALHQISDLISALKTEKCKLKSDVALLMTDQNNSWQISSENILLSLNNFSEAFHLSHQKCIYFERITESLISYFDNFANDFNVWLTTLKETGDEFISSNKLQLFQETSKQNFFNFFKPPPDCLILNECDTLIKDIEKFDINKQKMFDLFCNYVITNEKTLMNLKEQLNDYTLNNSNKLECDNVQQANSCNEETVAKSQLIEAETKLKKLKQISLKLKKELDDSKKQIREISIEKERILKDLTVARKELEKSSNEQYQCMQNYQSLQIEFDKTQDEFELQKENMKKFQEDFSVTLLELNALKEKILEKDLQIANSKEMLDASTSCKEEVQKLCLELEGKLIVAESKNEEKMTKIRELDSVIEGNLETIKVMTTENNNLKDQLSQALKDESKKTLLDLEMADYERSVSELNSKLSAKEIEIADLKQNLCSEIEKCESLQEEIKSTETLKETQEKRAANLKDVLDRTKAELFVAKELETDLLAKVSSLQLQLEIIMQQEENYKLQLSESSSEIQHLKEMLKTSSENNQRIVRSLESKIAIHQQDKISSDREVEAIKQEFENYKVRVHSVLRQQKSGTPSVSPIDSDLKEKLETIVDKLKIQVKDLNEKLTAVSLEHETLQEEYENLLQRYNKAMDEKAKKDSEWHSRLEQLNTEKNQLRIAQENLSSQHLLQNEMLVSTYKKQIKIMSEEHKHTINELQKQLESSDLEISRLQRDQQKSYGTPASSCNETPLPFDILSQERQEGEGSECTDDVSTPIHPLSLSTIPTSGFLPFEKLLQTSLEPGTPINFMQCNDCEKLISDLNVANKKIDHLSEVLNESESTNLRMSEQVRVLKEEVRRLERNKEREEHAENLEYLKNIFIKFSTLQASAEKAMLIPVLTTMLKLSPSEQQQLKNIAGDAETNDSSNSGWGSYLHRWSGIA
ncbi:GRIP and coiled-coil domain-containing protein 2 isoform X2 [Parasteatoda tepidariorum]|nr:GRIP and coiled-coil domain-containing protein 2 isoform X2 [Parasteatoda tepidariorum]XP_042896464.1 GRIP and coiled-coil domain-containing protein 2 isoform X2 [Parasteatoda tepidariorum]